MRKSVFKNLFLLCLVLLAPLVGVAQMASTDSAAVQSAVNHASSQANMTQSRLYNGKEYVGYSYELKKGHPFLEVDDWIMGDVFYDGVQFKNVALRYDLVLDELVIRHINEKDQVSLVNSKVKEFSLFGHMFYYVEPNQSKANAPAGFYDLVLPGKVSILAKRIKNIQGENFYTQKDMYYLVRDGNFQQVKNRAETLEALADRKKDMQAFLKENKLHFGKELEDALIHVVGHYNSLK